MRPRDEAEAAYFTLLRAREELDQLRHFETYLGDEARRLRRFLSEGNALADTIDPRLRRRLAHTRQPLHEAVQTRIASCLDELERMADRIADAEAFVTDCEAEHDRLRTS